MSERVFLENAVHEVCRRVVVSDVAKGGSLVHQHVILTLGRSGSNTLVDCCNQHPNLLNYGELLGEWNTIRKVQRRFGFRSGDDAGYLDALLQDRSMAWLLNSGRTFNKLRRFEFGSGKRLRDIRSIGFKDFSLNFLNYGLRSYLRDRDHIKVVGLQRRSLVDRILSGKMLRETGIVKAREDVGDIPQIRLEPDEILQSLEVFENESQLLDEMLGELPENRVHRIDYSDLYASADATQSIVGDVFEFLGVERRPVKIRMKKIVKNGALDAIGNLDECRMATRGTKYEGLFDEPANV